MAAGGQSADVEATKALISRQFASLDWAPGRSADWDTFAADFLPGASLYPAARPAKRQSVEGFVERMRGLTGTKLTAFGEAMLGADIHVFGNVAVALAACEMIENERNVNRGVEALLLVKDESGWRIAAQAWDIEKDGRTVPAHLTGTGREPGRPHDPDSG